MGLVRDLRGIAFAFNAKTSFMMLFDWMYPHTFPDYFFSDWHEAPRAFFSSAQARRYPTYMPILQRAIELWYHDPACTTPVLKLMAELVHNR